MATLNHSMMKFLLSSSLLFMILISCFLKRSSALEGRKETPVESHYHTVEISSLLPASVCSPSTTKGSNQAGQSTLKVFHRHGPCSYQGKNKTITTPSLSEVLAADQSRVESIQARVNPEKIKNNNSNSNKLKEKKATLPVQPGQSLRSGNYVVTIGLGTPRKTLTLIFDTGSDLTWTQCEPCIQSCYRQQDPIFDPHASSSYSNVTCDSAQCSELKEATGNSPGCATNTCVYEVDYYGGGQSYSVGYMSKEKLTLTSSDVFPDFVIGCGQNNQGSFGQTAGVLGLGRSALSFVSQTAPKYGKYFSYCLPSISSSTGHLKLGRNGAPNNMKFTPFKELGSAYFIDIIIISVGGRQLPISQSVFRNAGSIIHSGIVITRLPRAAYDALSAEFRKRMTKYPSAPAYSIFDTCYDFSGYTIIVIPTISFTFGGNVKIDLHPSGIVIVISRSVVCLAFARNGDESDVAIFGNTQQKTFEVGYDVAGGNLGFAPGGC